MKNITHLIYKRKLCSKSNPNYKKLKKYWKLILKKEDDLDDKKKKYQKCFRKEMTEKEIGYLVNDVRVVTNYIKEKMEEDGDILHIQYTKTGYVRKHCKEACINQLTLKKQEKIKVIYESRHQYTLKAMLSFFKVSKSTYFYTINTYSREDKDYGLKEHIKDILKD